MSPSLALRCLCLLLLLPRPAHSATPTDDWELITLKGRAIPEFLGLPTASLRAFAWHGRFEPIPFQVDEVDEGGRYRLTQGPKAQKERGRLELDDELVFYAGALGEAGPSAEGLPCHPRTRVNLPVGRGSGPVLGWITLVSCQEPLDRSPVDLVTYEASKALVVTPIQRVGYSATAPMNPDRLEFRLPSGSWTSNLLENIYVEGYAALLGGVFHATRTIEDFQSELVAWKDGPVRVIRRTSPRIRTFGDHYTNPGTFLVDSFHTVRGSSWRVEMSSSKALSTWLSELRMAVALDFRNLDGMTLSLPGSRIQPRADGQVSAREAAVRELDPAWMFFSGIQGSYVGWMTCSARVNLPRKLVYEERPGGRVRAGYRLWQLQTVPAGITHYEVTIQGMDTASLEDVTRYMRVRNLPLQRVKSGG